MEKSLFLIQHHQKTVGFPLKKLENEPLFGGFPPF